MSGIPSRTQHGTWERPSASRREKVDEMGQTTIQESTSVKLLSHKVH